MVIVRKNVKFCCFRTCVYKSGFISKTMIARKVLSNAIDFS